MLEAAGDTLEMVQVMYSCGYARLCRIWAEAMLRVPVGPSVGLCRSI